MTRRWRIKYKTINQKKKKLASGGKTGQATYKAVVASVATTNILGAWAASISPQATHARQTSQAYK